MVAQWRSRSFANLRNALLQCQLKLKTTEDAMSSQITEAENLQVHQREVIFQEQKLHARETEIKGLIEDLILREKAAESKYGSLLDGPKDGRVQTLVGWYEKKAGTEKAVALPMDEGMVADPMCTPHPMPRQVDVEASAEVQEVICEPVLEERTQTANITLQKETVSQVSAEAAEARIQVGLGIIGKVVQSMLTEHIISVIESWIHNLTEE